MKLANISTADVATWLETRDDIIIPIGATEQHSPYALIGTDHITATIIAQQLADRVNGLVAPALSYGMSNHHLAFPGTVSLRSATLIMMISDVVGSLARHGFRRFYFVNGHGGNMAPVSAAISDVQLDWPILYKMGSWFTMPEVVAKEAELFGEENGEHATASEVSLTMARNPELFPKPLPNIPVDQPIDPPFPLAPEHYKAFFPDGRMNANVGLASVEHGHTMMQVALDALQADFESFLALQVPEASV